VRRIVGLCGYGQVGKDTAAKHMPGWLRFAFGDDMRDDLTTPLYVLRQAGLAAGLSDMEIRELQRPTIVAFAEGVRKVNPRYWIAQLWPTLPATGDLVITDVRNPFEVEAIIKDGGWVIHITRPGYKARNVTERRTIAEIKRRWPGLPVVPNDGTPEGLGLNVLSTITWLGFNRGRNARRAG
jgi:hypothetical protein